MKQNIKNKMKWKKAETYIKRNDDERRKEKQKRKEDEAVFMTIY